MTSALAFGASGMPWTNHWIHMVLPPTTTGTLPRSKISKMTGAAARTKSPVKVSNGYNYVSVTVNEPMSSMYV